MEPRPRPPSGAPRVRVPSGWLVAVVVAGLGTVLGGCGLVRLSPPPSRAPSLAPPGTVGYVLCPGAVTPVELASRATEEAIPLPTGADGAPGQQAIATAPDGRWAYVVAEGGAAGPGAGGVPNELVPVDLVHQRAGTPVALPGSGPTAAVAVLDGGATVVAGSGTALVPVATAGLRVGTPIELGAGRTVSGLAVGPSGTTVSVLVPGGIVPVDVATRRIGPEIPTGLSVSSVASPHGIVTSPDGATVYAVGSGGPDFGGRAVAVDAAGGTVTGTTSFDGFGIADPAAAAVTADGGTLLVADSANDWIDRVPTGDLAHPLSPVSLPTSGTGSGHPTDIVTAPGSLGAFAVVGGAAVVPFDPASASFGAPVPVCGGATSMAVAPSP